MMNIITHQGIVENINGSEVVVRIIQTSACSACSVKGYCSSADSKEKLIEVTTPDAGSYKKGDAVVIEGRTSIGMQAVLLAFVVPFFLLIITLFVFKALTQNELYAALAALVVLIPYYCILWLNKTRLKQKFSFTIKPINN